MLLLRMLRVEAWVSKIPGFFVAVLALALYKPITEEELLWSTGFLLTHLCTGYLINDIADWNSDLASGDERTMHRLGRRIGYVVLLIFTGLHLLVCTEIAIAAPSRWVLLLGLTTLHFIYSVPPRLKSRGIWGVISSAINQWVAPFAVLVMQIGLGKPEAVLIAWLCLIGINGAVRHQMRDYYRDSIGEVQTFVRRIGPVQAVRLLYWIQRLVISVPLLLLLFLPLPKALVALVDTIGFTVYHTLYYKRLGVDQLSGGN